MLVQFRCDGLCLGSANMLILLVDLHDMHMLCCFVVPVCVAVLTASDGATVFFLAFFGCRYVVVVCRADFNTVDLIVKRHARLSLSDEWQVFR